MDKRATVIIPTYGEAEFALWAIKSVQRQKVKDIEICIICDGSPTHMVDFLEKIAQEDPRITVYRYPKAERTGEPYRHEVICKTTGRIILYCAHDDIWLPNHIETVEKALGKYDFVHTLHSQVLAPENIIKSFDFYSNIYFIDLKQKRIRKMMQDNKNFFGLTYGAHTREGYFRLKKGWETTPVKNMPTDLYMWNKFISEKSIKYKTVKKITAICFPADERKEWPVQKREEELHKYYNLTYEKRALKKAENLMLNLMKIFLMRCRNLSFQRIKRKVFKLFLRA